MFPIYLVPPSLDDRSSTRFSCINPRKILEKTEVLETLVTILWSLNVNSTIIHVPAKYTRIRMKWRSGNDVDLDVIRIQ